MAPQYLYNVYTQTILFSTILGRVCDGVEGLVWGTKFSPLWLRSTVGYLGKNSFC